METQNRLMTFGITVSELPITSTGAIKARHHSQWIKSRKVIDLIRMKALEQCFHTKMQRPQQDLFAMHPTYDDYLLFKGEEPIMHPMIDDVLFSKGGNIKNVTHYGTVEFADLVDFTLTESASSYGAPPPAEQNRKQRKAVRQAIIDEVHIRGGRFLMLDKKFAGGCCWVEIKSSSYLHNRVSTFVYDHGRRRKTKQKNRRSIKAMLAEKAGGASNPTLLKRRKIYKP